MYAAALSPLADVPISAHIAALPKADVHIHAVYAADNPWLLEQVARSGVTVECSLSCNVVLGATDAYEAHPIHQFVTSGSPVTLSTDDPVRVATTIGREYAIAALLGFTAEDLRGFTCNGVRASFAPRARRTAILAGIDASSTICMACSFASPKTPSLV